MWWCNRNNINYKYFISKYISHSVYNNTILHINTHTRRNDVAAEPLDRFTITCKPARVLLISIVITEPIHRFECRLYVKTLRLRIPNINKPRSGTRLCEHTITFKTLSL